MLGKTNNRRGSGIVIDAKSSGSATPLELIVGVDAGSTQTRVAVADANDVRLLQGDYSDAVYEAIKGRVYVIPSSYAVVTDEREISPNSANLEDNYDSHIIRVSTGAEKPLVGSERIVRGQKIADSAGLVTLYLDSSSNKMDNAIFYINVLDGIGYALLQKYNGNIPSKVKVHLVLSVRPKELNSPCQKKMNENFIGEFIFRWQGLNINIVIDGVTYTTEPEAQITGTAAVMSVAAAVLENDTAGEMVDKFNNSDSYIHIEGGGSSIGVEVVKSGNLVDACSSTFQLGGNYLIKIFIDRIRQMTGRVVSEESAAAAIQTCLLRDGKERKDVGAVVGACKNQVGRDIFERLRHDVIDITPDLSLQDMDFITLGGRLFNEDESGGSIGAYFQQYLAQVSPNTEVIILKDNYIPQGNLILGMDAYDISEADAPYTSAPAQVVSAEVAGDEETEVE